MIRSYQDLTVWQKGMQLASQVYKLSEPFPAHERYGLTSQMQRAAVSIPSNIAEGHSRASRKEYSQFLSIALGSLSELETQLLLAEQLGYLTEKPPIPLCLEIRKMLSALNTAIRNK